MCCLFFKMEGVSLNPLAGLRLLCIFFHFINSVNPSSLEQSLWSMQWTELFYNLLCFLTFYYCCANPSCHL